MCHHTFCHVQVQKWRYIFIVQIFSGLYTIYPQVLDLNSFSLISLETMHLIFCSRSYSHSTKFRSTWFPLLLGGQRRCGFSLSEAFTYITSTSGIEYYSLVLGSTAEPLGHSLHYLQCSLAHPLFCLNLEKRPEYKETIGFKRPASPAQTHIHMLQLKPLENYQIKTGNIKFQPNININRINPAFSTIKSEIVAS